MAKNSQLIWGMLGAFLVAGLIFSGALDGFLGSVTGPGEDGEGVTCDGCTGGETQKATLSAYDIDNVGTSLTPDGIYRKMDEVSWTSFTAGTEETGLELCEAYRFVFGIDSTATTDRDYGPVVDIDELSCIYNEKFALYDAEPEGDLSATFYNANDDASAQSFSAGDSYTVDVTFKTDSEDYFGNPYIAEQANSKGIEGPGGGHSASYPNVIVLELNSSEMDAPEKVEAITTEGDTVTLDKISVPGRQTLSSGNNYYAYEAPVAGDGIVRFMLSLNADDSNAPATDGTAYYYAAGWYVDSDTGDLMWGVENEEDTAIATDAADSVTLDFTP